MAEGLNKVMLLGNLCADGELRVTQGGQALLRLRLACSETYLDKNKVRQERTEFASVILWGKRGEALSKILTKGSRIFVEGKLQTSSWEDRESGQKRYRTEVVAQNVILAGGKTAGGGGGSRSGSSGGSHGGPDDAGPDDDGSSRGGGGYDDQDYGGDDNIPF